MPDEFDRSGYDVLPGVIRTDLIDGLLENYLSIVNQRATEADHSQEFTDPHGTDLVEFFEAHPEIEARVYTEIRERPWLSDLCRDPRITSGVRSLLSDDCALLSKIVFRIDLPRSIRELALWHQDYQYVRGNTSIITAWIPLQDTFFEQGCLSVMPGSHRLGALDHDAQIGKRQVPSGIFDREIRMVELEKGDLLLFDSLLLHSSNVNFSTAIRYSIQARYTPVGKEIDPGMGEPIALSTPVPT